MSFSFATPTASSQVARHQQRMSITSEHVGRVALPSTHPTASPFANRITTPKPRDWIIYVDLAVRRFEQFTGTAAVLAGDGRTYAEVAAQRAKGPA